MAGFYHWNVLSSALRVNPRDYRIGYLRACMRP
jgi:hypothetical protein